MKKMLFLTACAFLLSACVTEEGAKKHAAKQHQAAAVSLQWSATVYSSQRKNAKTETIGGFDSLSECTNKAMMHIKEKGYTDGAYSCSAQPLS